MINGLGLRLLLLVVGVALSIIGLVMNNWKLAVIGNTVAIGGMLFA